MSARNALCDMASELDHRGFYKVVSRDYSDQKKGCDDEDLEARGVPA
jgi:hypothetical protein